MQKKMSTRSHQMIAVYSFSFVNNDGPTIQRVVLTVRIQMNIQFNWTFQLMNSIDSAIQVQLIHFQIEKQEKGNS